MVFQLPSWLLPGTWLDNLRAASRLDWAGGMEFLVLSFEGTDRELFLRESPLLSSEGRGLDLGIHLPDPLVPANRELVEATESYAKYYVVHPPRSGAGEAGLEAFASLMEDLVAGHGGRFLLEYTREADFRPAEAFMPGLGLCADTAHLLAEGLDPATWIGERRARVGEVHLNGYRGGKAHLPLSGEEAWLPALLPLLEKEGLRVELEIFSLAGVEASYQALKEFR